jgi:hypothetical protein
VRVVKFERGTDSAWFYLDPGRNLYVRLHNPMGNGISPLDMNGWRPVDYGKRWMLVWVDSNNGRTYSAMQVQQPRGYQATTKSCYTSIVRA